MNLLPQLICAHLVGDFLLQNDWMQAKSRSTFVAFVHVCVYLLPFWQIVDHLGDETRVLHGLVLYIGAEHFLQDRFALHLLWMRIFGQTPVERWPVGPLCVDQAMHIAFIWLFASIAGVA